MKSLEIYWNWSFLICHINFQLCHIFRTFDVVCLDETKTEMNSEKGRPNNNTRELYDTLKMYNKDKIPSYRWILFSAINFDDNKWTGIIITLIPLKFIEMFCQLTNHFESHETVEFYREENSVFMKKFSHLILTPY